MKTRLSRRRFLSATCAGAAVSGISSRKTISRNSPSVTIPASTDVSDQLALLGGRPVRTAPFPAWPVIGESEEQQLMEALRSKRWNRHGGSFVEKFESAWAERLGAKHCLATSSGTSALVAAMQALEIGPGDEVIVPPYTFVATINVVLLQHALPVFVDSDRETFQIDANKIEAAITRRTRCILPVHLGGAAANLDVILSVAKKHGIPVIEDACQSHLAEWRKQKVGTFGDLGCFSLQASKNLNSGEGGAVVSNNEALLENCRSFHNQGRAAANTNMTYARNGDNRRMTEFQGAILLAQLARLEEQSKIREQNAGYLTRQLREIPGIAPARMYEGCTRNAYHLYMFRYNQNHFSGLAREKFLKAMQAEGIPCSGGYAPLNKEPFLKSTLNSRAYRYIYPAKVLEELAERNSHCPENDRLCHEAVWLTQTMLLGSSQDMDQIAEAVRKIQKQATLLARS
ncbi:MAG TPA: DegT/DnrJ/EryC1/StrS family aminotransferase [Blastocatellia bacterium]|nr:DegT/DnrJ/EryC1/StrS family aminotransferase [Blastocatellia bacterium]